MKPLAKFLAIAFALVIFSSCDKRDDPKPKSTSKLVGKWTVASSQTLLSVNGKSYKEFLMEQGLSEEDADIFTEIVEGMLTLTGFYAAVEFKDDYTWTGDSEFSSTQTAGGWELSSDEKTLTMTDKDQPGVTQTATITKLTDTDFWFELAPEDLDVQGAPPGAQYTAVVKLTRTK
jgi:hypothetical protein